MSARSCQLCGKPLSRIWVGSGGDFCSREHRNQYRLRQGMGRLQEANKVASVMRRREQLRPLTSPNTSNATSVERRGFFQIAFVPTAKAILPPVPLAAALASPRIADSSNDFIAPRALGGALPTAAQAAMTVPFPTRRASLTSPRRQRKLPTRMVQAQAVEPKPDAPPPVGKRRTASIRLSRAKRLPWRRRIGANPAGQLLRAHSNSHAAKATPARGNALRVSCACGFRPRSSRRVFAPIAARIDARLRWREARTTLRTMEPESAVSRAADGVAMPVGSMQIPAGPPPAARGKQSARPAVDLRLPRMRTMAPTAPTHMDAGPWIPQSDRMEFPNLALLHWQPELSGAHAHVPPRPRAATGQSTSKHLLSPFIPQDVPCGFSLNVNQNGSKDQKR